MLNKIWASFFFLGALAAIYHIVVLGNPAILNEIMESIFSMAQTGFEIAIGLTGVMCLWLGIMKIGENGGMVYLISKALAPFLRRLFPEIPDGHPASTSIVMNLSANMLGLDNAATPLGLKAMKELQAINPEKDTASNAMIMFLVINTSSVTIVPLTIFTYLYQLSYPNPTELFIPILLATTCSSLAGLIAVSIYQRINLFQPVLIITIGVLMCFIAGFILLLLSMDKSTMQTFSLVFSNSIILGIILLFLTRALIKKVNVYESFIDGAKEGFKVAITIIPFLVAMLVAIGIFRTSGALDILLDLLTQIFMGIAYSLDWLGILAYSGEPLEFVDALPTAFMKPLSGSGARGLMIETMESYGPTAFASRCAAIMQGSTETTFYVLAVYFGSIAIKKTRYAITCGLIADFTGITAAIILCYLFFG
jgi:spore maturation protein SpmA